MPKKKIVENPNRTDAQRRAKNKYAKKTYRNVSCLIRMEDADAFQEYCEAQGKTMSRAVKEYVYKCIGKAMEG